ncbi:MAG: cysteine hydrolase, partial [Clostridiales bacterium]|nr:cysteine hydrolase [Clostridiales bacterium]
ELPVEDSRIFDKVTFGSMGLAQYAAGLSNLEEVQLIGLCTDICVISNAMLLKAALPEVPISVDAGCCAGVTPESHKNALAAMEACQIEIRNADM